jgi:PhnB protein
MAVNYIPEGYRTVTPYLSVKGADQAIEWYKKALGAEEVVRMPGPDGKLMHGEIKIGDSMVMLSEEFPEQGHKSPQSLGGSGVSIHLYVRDCDASYKRAVDAGAKGNMPPMDMFWGDRFGKFTDPYGHQWSVATHIEEVEPAEMEKRMQAEMKKMAGGGGA